MLKKSIFILISICFFIPSYSSCSEPRDAETDLYHEDIFAELESQFSDTPVIYDPFISINKSFFYFNDKFYYYILQPAAESYKYIMPYSFQKCIDNFFHNLSGPARIINSLIQGKFDKGANEFRNFVINSTVGLFGFLTPAKTSGKIELLKEDFGQSLATYGIKNGFYLVIPFLGPTTIRDLAGRLIDSFLNPFSYIDSDYRLATEGVQRLNYTSLHLGEYEKLMKAAIDPYEQIKDVYLQLRAEKIKH